jgi:hypothetical protein
MVWGSYDFGIIPAASYAEVINGGLVNAHAASKVDTVGVLFEAAKSSPSVK